MTLEILQNEMIKALKEHNKFRKDTISTLVGAVKNAAIAKNCRNNITEELVNEALLKEQKTVREQIETCPESRTDLLEEYNAKLNIINEFAPQLITDSKEIETIVRVGTIGMELTKANRGKIMKLITPILKGKADMKIVSQVVGDILV